MFILINYIFLKEYLKKKNRDIHRLEGFLMYYWEFIQGPYLQNHTFDVKTQSKIIEYLLYPSKYNSIM